MNANDLEYLLRPTPLYGLLRGYLHRKAWRDWQKNKRPPAPHAVKSGAVRRYARQSGARIFVETGTFFGDMLDAVCQDFRKLYSIELSKRLHRKAARRFAEIPHIELIQGDSGEELPRLLGSLNEPALFWLDGHFSGGVTARGNTDTPIVREVDAVLSHRVEEHVVLIDDARLFGKAPDYPPIDELRAAVKRLRPDWIFRVQDDIICMGRADRVGTDSPT